MSPDTATNRPSPAKPPNDRRRLVSVVLTGCLALGAAAGLAQGVTSCATPARSDASRPLSAAEAQRLATMRLQNFRDGRARLRATIGRPGRELRLSGWVDWQLPLAYFAVDAGRRQTGASPFGFGPAATSGLVQAVPDAIATRTSPAGQADPAGTAPAVPPADGWRVHRPAFTSAAKAPVDRFVGLLFTIASSRADAADPLARSDARWLRRDLTGGVGVDVLLGPAVPPDETKGPAPTALAAMGGAVRYWIDDRSRLRRLEALLAADLPVQLDLEPGEHRELSTVDALGGHPVAPRAPSQRQVRALTQLRGRARAAGGGRITLTLPTPGGGLQHATGWIDWRRTVAYIVIRDADRDGPGALVWADPAGIAVRAAGRAAPPLPPPAAGWRVSSWSARGDAQGAYDLDLLLRRALAPDARSAVFLRAGVLGRGKVSVYGDPRGVRYWLDREGVLRRVELRTRSGGFAQLDIAPAKVPDLRR